MVLTCVLDFWSSFHCVVDSEHLGEISPWLVGNEPLNLIGIVVCTGRWRTSCASPVFSSFALLFGASLSTEGSVLIRNSLNGLWQGLV